MNKTIATTALLVLIAAVALTQIALRDRDVEPGLITDRVARIDAAINAEVDVGKIPGAVALIVKNGEVVYHKSFGFADIDSQAPMQTDSIFRIASMSKAITSVAAMTLYEQGHFRLNDPVAKYIPEFANMSVISATDGEGNITETVPATRPIRIIDLMTHAS